MIVPDWLIAEVLEHIGWDKISTPILTPNNPPLLDNTPDWGKHQSYLKVLAYINQNGTCLCDQQILSTEVWDLHHALVSRKDAMGTKHPQLIHHSYNVLLLHRACHISATRQRSKEFLSEIYGQKNIDNWLKGLPFKIGYFKGLFT